MSSDSSVSLMSIELSSGDSATSPPNHLFHPESESESDSDSESTSESQSNKSTSQSNQLLGGGSSMVAVGATAANALRLSRMKQSTFQA